MTHIPPKKITLRAFRIENPYLTEVHSGILSLMERVLTQDSTASQRRMLLNAEEPDRDLLANFSWASNSAYLFGMMLRIIPGDNGGVISEDMFDQPVITMAQIDAGNAEESQYKDHFYFALNNNYMVTNLAGNIGVDRLQTYINWLLGDVRGDRLFQFTELTRLPEGIKLSQIKDIQFVAGGNTLTATASDNESTSIYSNLSNIANDIMDFIMGGDTTSLEQIRNNQLVEARLLLKIKGRPKNMARDEFQRVMGAVATNISNDQGFQIRTKEGNTYNGSAVKVKKNISVQCIGPNRIVEEQLKQEMELFLNEIKAQQDV